MLNQTLFIMAFKFEKLNVWKDAVELSGDISDRTKKFPKEEIYALTSQVRRAADSISLNIAEGSTGQSNPEFRRFSRLCTAVGNRSGCLFFSGEAERTRDIRRVQSLL